MKKLKIVYSSLAEFFEVHPASLSLHKRATVICHSTSQSQVLISHACSANLFVRLLDSRFLYGRILCHFVLCEEKCQK